MAMSWLVKGTLGYRASHLETAVRTGNPVRIRIPLAGGALELSDRLGAAVRTELKVALKSSITVITVHTLLTPLLE